MVNSGRGCRPRPSNSTCHAIPGKARTPLGSRPASGIPRPARRRLVVAVQHRVPGGVPGRDELPRLPEPRRRGPLRRGLHPLPRAQPGRGDVFVRLFGAVRASLSPRRHRPTARDPRDEALPRRVARGLGDPRRHAPDHAPRGACRRRRRRPGRTRRRARTRDEGLPRDRLRQPPLRRRDDAHRRAGLPPAARSDRDGRPPRRAPRGRLPVRHDDRQGHHVRAAPEGLRRDRDHRRRDGRGGPRHPGVRSRRRRLRRRLHEEGEPRSAARSRSRRRRHRRRLHGDGLLADVASVTAPRTSRSSIGERAPSSSSTRRNSARPSARASAWSSSPARSRSSARTAR